MLVLSLIVALLGQASGLESWLSPGELSAAQVGDECSECPLERDGQSCPPACPKCHCGHAGMAVPPAVAGARIDAAGSVPVRWESWSSDSVPTPFIAGPFRPPSVALCA